MGAYGGPHIIQDGLILYSDPANPKSNEGGINMADMMGNYNDSVFSSTEMSIGGSPKVITSNGDGGNFRYLEKNGNYIDWGDNRMVYISLGIKG